MSPGQLRLLLVEDSEDDALLVLRELRAHGYEPVVRRVETAAALREALGSASWDIVLSDFNLPGFSAPEALRVVHEHDPDLPFIIISGAIGEETAVTALKEGAQDFIIKGNLARLVPAIERELREASARRAHRAAARALAERDELLRALVDASPAGILMVDSQERVQIRNAAATSIMAAVNGAAGSSSSGGDLAILRPIVDRALAGESIRDERVTGGDGDARPLHLEVSAGPIGPQSAPAAGAVVIAINVSERVSLEEQLRQAQKLEAVGRLAGGVAHDFNNILTAISAYAEFLLHDLPDEGSLQADAAEIKKAAERGAGLTRQLLALSRKQVIQREHVDLGRVVQGLETMLRRLIGEDIAFEISAEPGLSVFADRGQLEQILMNLVVNARDAMPEGGTIAIRTAPAGPVEAEGRSWAVLEVRDEGLGIPPDALGRIFDPFFTTKEAGRGTGLGLSTVQSIVEQSGGQLAVDSEVGKGARFRIYLPISQGSEEAVAPRQVPERPANRSATVLVVEDDEAIRAVTARSLRDSGFTVFEADSGEAALEEAARVNGEVDLLLIDVILPRGSGPATARRLRERHGISRVLFMSGYTGDALAQHPDVDVRGNLIGKPFTQGELIARMDQMLAGRDKGSVENA